MKKIAQELDQYLADLHVAYMKIHNYHWNVIGESFFTLHVKLEEFYTVMNTEIDLIAERILSIGAQPTATLKEYLKMSKIKETPSKNYKGAEAVKSLKEDFNYLLELVKSIQKIAGKDNDNGTVALLDNSVDHYEKSIWMLKAYLK